MLRPEYERIGRVLRIESTGNNVTFFKRHRQVEQKGGTTTFTSAPVRNLDLRRHSAGKTTGHVAHVLTVSAVRYPGPAQYCGGTDGVR